SRPLRTNCWIVGIRFSSLPVSLPRHPRRRPPRSGVSPRHTPTHAGGPRGSSLLALRPGVGSAHKQPGQARAQPSTLLVHHSTVKRVGTVRYATRLERPAAVNADSHVESHR